MMRQLVRLTCALLIALAMSGVAWAQGVQTGVVTGTITSPDGATVPGTTVTVLSPALQGMKSAESDVNGVYVIRGLPPGAYVVTFDLSGMGSVKKEAMAFSSPFSKALANSWAASRMARSSSGRLEAFSGDLSLGNVLSGGAGGLSAFDFSDGTCVFGAFS